MQIKRIVASLIVAANIGSLAFAQRQTVAKYAPQTVLRKPLPAIRDAPFVAAEDSKLARDELVIGVVVNDRARAYPINQLTGPKREIINDTLGETAIAATW